MIKSRSDAAWEDFEYWMRQDKKTLRRILQLLKDIDRNGYEGIGKPERLSGDAWGFEKGDSMTYTEKEISYDDYVRLKESVNWNNFFKGQMEKCLRNTLYSIKVIEDHTVIGMGRLIGDGMYYMMVDVIVEPNYQGRGIGSNIVNKLIEYVHRETPVGGRSSMQLVAEKGKEGF